MVDFRQRGIAGRNRDEEAARNNDLAQFADLMRTSALSATDQDKALV
jgi:hypothetical protein